MPRPSAAAAPRHIRLEAEPGYRYQLTVILWGYDIYPERPTVSPPETATMVPMARVFAGISRREVSAWALALDAVIAVAASALAIAETISHAQLITVSPLRRLLFLSAGVSTGAPGNWYPSVWQLAAVVLMAAPLAVRRLYPVTACAVIFAAACALPYEVPPVVFATAIFAVFSAVLYSPHRNLAIGVALAGAIATAATFPDSQPGIPERYTALIVVVPTVAAGLGIRELLRRAGDSAARLR